MKFLIPICLLFFLYSCKEAKNNLNKKNVTLKLSKKELSKLFKGQELYSIKGIKSNFESKNIRVKSLSSKKDHILHLDFNNLYFEGSKEILLHSNTKYIEVYESLKWYINKNKLIWPKTELLTVNFNQGVKKDFVLFSIPDKETIEYGGKRFVQKLSYLSDKKRFDIEKSEILNMVDYIGCYDYDYESLVLLYFYLKDMKLTVSSSAGVKIIPNPVTNTLEFLLDFSQISIDRKGINFEDYIEEINELKKFDSMKFEKALKIFLEEQDIFENKIQRKNNYKEYIIKGELNLYEDLNLTNVNLKIEPNTKINLFDNSKIIINKGIVSFNGEVDKPIIIKGNGENSIFVSDVDLCSFNYTRFDGLSNWMDDCKVLPSAITIYNSKSIFYNCEFKNNKRGDDMINLFQSKYTFKQCLFNNVLSDAVDSDFSEGEIAETFFSSIGNDAVDCSGSTLKITGSFFEKVSDKAISAGENSNINVTKSKIINSAIGYVSKDGSILNVEGGNEFKDNDLDFAVFMKKPFYKRPSLYFSGEINNYKYLIQEKSIINSKDDVNSLKFLNEVESKLYGNEYGKSSK